MNMKAFTYVEFIIVILVIGILALIAVSVFVKNKDAKDIERPGNIISKLSTVNKYQIIVIDSCEYIEVDEGALDNRVYSLTHKGNCTNCVNRYK